MDLKRAAHPKDEARHAESLLKATRTVDHRPDVALQTVRGEKDDQNIVDQSTVDVTMTEVDDPTTDLDQKVATVDRTANHRADVHRDLRTADLVVIETIVRDHLVAKVVQTARREKKDDLTEIVDQATIADQLDRKAKAARSDVKLL